MAIYVSSVPLAQGDKKSIKKDSASKQEIMQSWVPCYANSLENFLDLETDQCTLPVSLPCSCNSIHWDTVFFWASFECKWRHFFQVLYLLQASVYSWHPSFVLSSCHCPSLWTSVASFPWLLSHYVMVFLRPVPVPLSPSHSSYEEMSKGQLVAENKRWPSEPCILYRELFKEWQVV